MNTEDFVTYKQALALKKLGFKERCYNYYDTSGIMHDNDVICNEVFQYIISSQLLGSHNSGIPKETCDAPTLAQAQKFLLKNGYFIRINPCNFLTTFTYQICTSKVTNRESFNAYNSPEEALSAGITECIKLLEND